MSVTLPASAAVRQSRLAEQKPRDDPVHDPKQRGQQLGVRGEQNAQRAMMC